MIHVQRATGLFAAIALAVASSFLHGQNVASAAADGNAKAAEARRLIAVLRSDAATVDKARACQQLAALSDKEAAPALAALLADEKLAGHARSALESIADPSAADALRDALGRLHGRLLAGVVNSLGVRRDAQAVEPLRKLAGERTFGVADEALMALGRIATPEAVNALRQALAASSAESRSAAADACLTCAERLLALGKRDEAVALLDLVRASEAPKHVRAAATYRAILARQSADLSLLIAQLKADDGALFGAAIRASCRMPGPEVTRALLAELDRLPPARQAVVIGALADRHDASLLTAMRKAASAGPREVRLAAIRALGQLGGASTAPLLLETALAADRSLAQAARASLALTKADGVDAALAARLNQGDPKDRVVLLDILGQRGAGSAAAAVLKAADDPASEVRMAAIRALGQIISPEDVPALVGRLPSAKTPQERAVVQEALRTACNRAPDQDASVRRLCDCMSRTPLAEQCFLLELIGEIGGDEALKIVAARARGGRPEIQDAAIRVLGQWMSVDAAPVLLDLAKTLADVRLRARALRGCLRIARQLDLPRDRRLAMCEEAFAAAQRDEEKQLAAEVARVVVGKGASDAQTARARVLVAKARRKSGPLFDGRTFDGWEGDAAKTFRIEDGAIVGGTLKARVPHNEFLCTTKSYANFVLRAECKLLGNANGGIQFRSQRVPNDYEVSGFQADMDAGPDGGLWGSLYDESRRNRALAAPDKALLRALVKPGWNQYEIRCEGPRIRLFLNGVQTVDYIEHDAKIPASGIIGLQIHGGDPSEAWYRNIVIEELP